MARGEKPSYSMRVSVLPFAVERYFQTSLYLLIVTGFATLAGTGKLDGLSLLVVASALVYRGSLLLQGREKKIPERWTSYVTLAYIAFYGIDFFLVSQSFVTATVHLVLFSMVVKIFSVQRDRDYIYLAVLAFLMVLAAAVLTVDSFFLMGFSVFMLLAVSTFISMEMRRSANSAAQHGAVHTIELAAEGAEAKVFRHPLARRMSFSLSGTAVAMVVSILLSASVIFFLLPRVSTGYLSAFAPHTELVSGFSNDVRLGEIGVIKQSNTVVMHVQIQNDPRGQYDLKFRGVALGLFDGARWTNPMQALEVLDSTVGHYDLSEVRRRYRDQMGEPPMATHFKALNYKVTMEPVGTNVFFLTGRTRTLTTNSRTISVDAAAAIANLDRERVLSSYDAWTDVSQPAPEDLRRASGPSPEELEVQYLQLPGPENRVRDLAQKVTSSATNNYDRALALEQHLRTSYTYTLVLPQTPPRDPIVNFLFERKAGHCEYFASSMAIMLRTLGIPSRVVNGFRGGEFNDLTGSYIIRGRDAHTWVEAYFPGQGWATFDPTPPDPKPVANSWARLALYMDALREFWREWVINYDFFHQRALTTTATQQSRRFALDSRDWVQRKYKELLRFARRTERRASRSPKQFGAGVSAAVLVLLLLVNLRRFWRAFRVRQISLHPERAPQAAASIWYARLTRKLSHRGWRKAPSQTPDEFLHSIEDEALRERVAEFTRRYKRARFGESVEDARALPELYSEITGR